MVIQISKGTFDHFLLSKLIKPFESNFEGFIKLMNQTVLTDHSNEKPTGTDGRYF